MFSRTSHALLRTVSRFSHLQAPSRTSNITQTSAVFIGEIWKSDRSLGTSSVHFNQDRNEWQAWEGAGLAQRNRQGPELVYTGPMNKHVVFLGFMSYTVAAVGGSMLPTALYDMGLELPTLALLMEGILPPTLGLAMPFILHFAFIRKYVRELYYNSEKDEFMAVVTQFFLRRKGICFKTGDVSTTEARGLVTKDLTTFSAKGRPFIVLSNHFKTPEYFNYLMSQRSQPQAWDDDDSSHHDDKK